MDERKLIQVFAASVLCFPVLVNHHIKYNCLNGKKADMIRPPWRRPRLLRRFDELRAGDTVLSFAWRAFPCTRGNTGDILNKTETYDTKKSKNPITGRALRCDTKDIQTLFISAGVPADIVLRFNLCPIFGQARPLAEKPPPMYGI